jgi:metallo-beta-lactamase class B
MSVQSRLRLAGLGALLLAVPALAQDLPATRPAVSGYAKPVAYPNANAAAVAEHFNRARKIAGDDLYTFFNTLCVVDQEYKERTNGVQYNGLIPAQKVFDNLFHVGQMMVSAWAIRTDDGIVLIDALNNADEAREIIVPGLQQMGLDPKTIKYVIITHAHGDHYGGAQYFRDTYGARMIASAQDWEVMGKPSVFDRIKLFDPAPRKLPDDITIADGQTLTLGGLSIRFAVTPGHTPGTLSLYFPVADNGARHMAGLYGGIGMPRSADMKTIQLQSMTHWMDMTRRAGVDAEIGNHPLHFDGPTRLDVLRHRPAGAKNPFVLGAGTYQRFIDLQRECVKLSLAREGITQ